MSTIDFHLLLSTLSCVYHAEYKRLQSEYQTQRRKGLLAPDQTEEQYILTHMPEILAERKQRFTAQDAKNRISAVLPLFTRERHHEVQNFCYPTGYKHLDEALDGGYKKGLHIIGAISSLGKSTFCLQLADQMASRRIPVLYISMEMDKNNLTAKLISQHIFTDVGERWAKTSSELTSSRMDNCTDEEWAAVGEAVSAISSHAEYITIMDACEQRINIGKISSYVHDYMQAYGTAPVVIIDYLQILMPPEGMSRATDKQVVDHNVAEFHSLAEKYKIPVIIISSFNRDSYTGPVSSKSYKESGTIEYSSDTLIGLQLQGTGKPGFDIEAAKAASVRKIELVVLKQRNGRVGIKIGYDFYTEHSYFEEQKEEAPRKICRIS